MEARAITRFVRLSPQKVRLVVDQIRGKGVEEALNILKFVPKRSADIIAKTLRTAVANAENAAAEKRERIDTDGMRITRIEVGEGIKLRRFQPSCRGRALPIRKRSSHIYLEIGG